MGLCAAAVDRQCVASKQAPLGRWDRAPCWRRAPSAASLDPPSSSPPTAGPQSPYLRFLRNQNAMQLLYMLYLIAVSGQQRVAAVAVGAPGGGPITPHRALLAWLSVAEGLLARPSHPTHCPRTMPAGGGQLPGLPLGELGSGGDRGRPGQRGAGRADSMNCGSMHRLPCRPASPPALPAGAAPLPTVHRPPPLSPALPLTAPAELHSGRRGLGDHVGQLLRPVCTGVRRRCPRLPDQRWAREYLRWGTMGGERECTRHMKRGPRSTRRAPAPHRFRCRPPPPASRPNRCHCFPLPCLQRRWRTSTAGGSTSQATTGEA